MKKLFILLFSFFTLVSCTTTTPTPAPTEIASSIEVETKTPPLQDTATPSPESTTFVPLKTNNENFRIPAEFSPFFDDENLYSTYAWTTAVIVYTGDTNKKITDFSEIDNHSTAHIFVDPWCYNQEKNILHIKSASCDASMCTFSLYDNFSLAELVKKDLFTQRQGVWKIMDATLIHPKSGKIPAIFNARQDCSPQN